MIAACKLSFRLVVGIEYRPLSEGTLRTGFISGDSDIDRWFLKKAWQDHSSRKHVVTCASFEEADAAVIGFFALSTVVESAANLGAEVPFFAYQDARNCPCLQLTYMAIHKDHQCKEHGTLVLARVVQEFAHVGTQIGIPALIVMPGTARARRFYDERGGFTGYAKGAGMFMPLQTALATLTEAEASSASAEGS